MMKHLLIASGVATTVLVLFLVACKATVEAGENVPGIGGSTVTIEVDPQNRTGSVPPQGSLPAGICIQVTFFGPDGNKLGSTTTSVGATFSIPAGAANATVDGCEGGGGKKKKKKKRRGASVLHLGQFGYSYIPLDVANGPYRYADFWVTAADGEQADQLADDFILGLLSEPPPVGVQPEGVTEIQVEPDSSVRVSMFSTSEPQTLDFEWNGAFLYDLDDASVLFANGWYVTTVLVPSTLVEVDLLGSSENSFRFNLGLSSGAEVGTAMSVLVTQ